MATVRGRYPGALVDPPSADARAEARVSGGANARVSGYAESVPRMLVLSASAK